MKERNIRIHGAVNLKSCPISEFPVICRAEDLLYTADLLPAYVALVDTLRDDIQYRVYYRKKFLSIADTLKTVKDHSVHAIGLAYGDLKLLVCMFRDERTWNGTEHNDKEAFRKLADSIACQIGYDYDEALAKCQKRAEKEDRDDDIGGEAISLMFKKAKREAEYQKKKQEEKERSHNGHVSAAGA